MISILSVCLSRLGEIRGDRLTRLDALSRVGLLDWEIGSSKEKNKEDDDGNKEDEVVEEEVGEVGEENAEFSNHDDMDDEGQMNPFTLGGIGDSDHKKVNIPRRRRVISQINEISQQSKHLEQEPLLLSTTSFFTLNDFPIGSKNSFDALVVAAESSSRV